MMVFWVESYYGAGASWSEMKNQGYWMLNDGWWRARIPHEGATNYICHDGHVGSFRQDLYTKAYLNQIAEVNQDFWFTDF